MEGRCDLKKDILQYADFRDLLADIMVSRKARNRGYSKRAFSRDIGVSPSFLVEVMKCKYQPSQKLAASIAKNLKFNEEEVEQFCILVERSDTASGNERLIKKSLKSGLCKFHLMVQFQVDAVPQFFEGKESNHGISIQVIDFQLVS